MGWLLWLYQLLCFFFLLYSQLSCSSPVLSSSNSTSAKLCSHEESLALLQFNQSFTITASADSFPKRRTWEEATDCCVWDGVTCDRLTGHVIGLDLSWSRLHGTIHSNSTLFQLHHLQRLNLAGNDFDCSQIPSEFGRLSKLTHLNLYYSNFSGSVPQSLGNLTQITDLDLSYNNFNGQFPFSVANFSLLDSLRLSNNKLTFPTASHISGLPKLAHLDLSYNSINGTIPAWLFTLPSLQYLDLRTNDLAGPIPNQASGLQNLTYLDLNRNSLNGTIPSWLFTLPSLQQLNLRENDLAGPITNSASGLQNLIDIDFSGNSLIGTIPSWLFTLPSLESVGLSGNYLIGPIPNGASRLQNLTDLNLARNSLNGTLPSWLFALPSLKYLDLSDNIFTGHIDEFQYNSLDTVDLSQNNLQGSIPKSIFKLVNLQYLYLSSNNLSGIVELHMFSKLKNLIVLDLSYNSLSCNTDNNNASFTFPSIEELRLSSCEMSEFPRFLRNQEYLEELDLSNNKIHGHIPEWLGNMSFQNLNLSYNFLTSLVQLPWMVSHPSSLDLRFNLLQGPLPIPPRNTEYFFVSNNELAGEIPSLICNASSLQILDVSNNILSGVIPQCLGNCSAKLSVLDLRMNRFRGPIPTNFAECTWLRNLNLNGNQLEGLVPRSLVNCRRLQVLDLGNNNITNTFPYWLETLPELQILVLRSNKFHGPINSTSNEKSPFPKLRIIDLSHNEFTGLLPKRYLEGLRAMMNIDKEKMELKYMGGYYYDDSVMVTIKGKETELVRILTIFTTLDLSCNKFEGDIPSVVGKLNSLRLLNISHNNLTGHVPSVLGSLTMLESLDLSSNQLLGKIPWQLTDLTFLAVLNLSNNHLEGPIPRGKQFETFQSDSYNGNLELCGFPLPNRCGNGEAPQQPPSSVSQQDNDSDFLSGFSWGITMMGYGCGLVFGLSMGYIMFSTGKPKWFVRIIEEKCCQKVKKLKKSNQRRAGRGNIRFIRK